MRPLLAELVRAAASSSGNVALDVDAELLARRREPAKRLQPGRSGSTRMPRDAHAACAQLSLRALESHEAERRDDQQPAVAERWQRS